MKSVGIALCSSKRSFLRVKLDSNIINKNG